MKTAPQTSQAVRMERAEAVVQSSITALFRRLPLLAGFHVGDDLTLESIEFDRWPGFTPTEELYDEIAKALLAAIDEREEALELLRNRTFARTLQ
jgi:hypothetical protein